MSARFNGGLLRVARQRKGYSQGDAARHLGMQQQVTLSRYENGATVPSEEFAARAATVYGFPTSFFYQPDAPFGAPVSVHPMWRKKHDVSARELDAIVAELNIRAMHTRRMLEAVVFAPRHDIPRLEPDDFNGDIERVAALVRAHWRLPPGPVSNLTEAVERAGAMVVHSDLNGSAVSGVTIAAPGMPPIIILNAADPADRMRFTLAHEIGHLVMHKFPGPTMEDEANEFARSLLMPSADIKASLMGRVDLRRLAALKPEWRVSMQAILYRAQSLNLVGKSEAGWLWRQFGALKMRLAEPAELDFPREQPAVVERMVGLHLDVFGMSNAEFATLLHMHEDDLWNYYRLPSVGAAHLTKSLPPKQPPKLRLVR